MCQAQRACWWPLRFQEPPRHAHATAPRARVLYFRSTWHTVHIDIEAGCAVDPQPGLRSDSFQGDARSDGYSAGLSVFICHKGELHHDHKAARKNLVLNDSGRVYTTSPRVDPHCNTEAEIEKRDTKHRGFALQRDASAGTPPFIGPASATERKGQVPSPKKRD